MSSSIQHIETKEDLLNGKPKIIGRRITVQNIVLWHERLGKSVDEISAEYNLTLSEIHAALSYYFDHQDEIDNAIHNDQSIVNELRKNSPSKLKEKLTS